MDQDQNEKQIDLQSSNEKVFKACFVVCRSSDFVNFNLLLEKVSMFFKFLIILRPLLYNSVTGTIIFVDYEFMFQINFSFFLSIVLWVIMDIV